MKHPQSAEPGGRTAVTPRHRRLFLGALSLGLGLSLVACGGGGDSAAAPVGSPGAAMTSGAMPPGSGSQVTNHVHGAVPGATPAQILLGTHFGLRVSDDAGATWHSVPGLGGDMVAAIVRVAGGYVAAFQPMGSAASSGMGASMASPGMAGSSMGSAGSSGSAMGPAYVMYSPDGTKWTRSVGLPAGAAVGNLVGADSGPVAWASLSGHGIYRTADGGRTWTNALATTGLITTLYQTGTTLIFATPDGVDITSTEHPSVPASRALSQGINDMSSWSACPTCLVATLASGGVASSRDGGQTWQTLPSGPSFDNVVSFPSTGATLFGMVASPTESNQGVWRSTDGGHTWSEMLKQPQVDYMFATPQRSGSLLAFQWGINVWKSADAGATWTRLASV